MRDAMHDKKQLAKILAPYMTPNTNPTYLPDVWKVYRDSGLSESLLKYDQVQELMRLALEEEYVK